MGSTDHETDVLLIEARSRAAGRAGACRSGCDPISPRLETEELRRAEHHGKRSTDSRPLTAIPRKDQRSQAARAGPGASRSWALKQRAGASQAAIFSRVEVLPPTQTVLPYGVGAFQQEPRLPAILTTGPGWAELKPDEKEARVAAAFGELSGQAGCAEARSLAPADLDDPDAERPGAGLDQRSLGRRKNLHGEEQSDERRRPRHTRRCSVGKNLASMSRRPRGPADLLVGPGWSWSG